MLSLSKFLKTCTLMSTLQLLLAFYACAEDNALLNSCESINLITDSEQVETCYSSLWLKPGPLNSERINLKFGSYGVEVIAQDQVAGVRLSSLYSMHEGKKITRTVAFTQYESELNEKLNTAHHEILAGGSIGSTLKKYGFDIQKNLFFKALVEDLPEQVQILTKTHEKAFPTVIYHLLAKEGINCYPYCTIVEVYSPEFLNMEEVNQIYPEIITEKTKLQKAMDVMDIIDRMKQVLFSFDL